MSEVIATGHWEVTRAKNAGQKPNPHGGEFDKWYVGLKNLDGGNDCPDAYWQRKSPSEVTVGDKVYGKLEKNEHGFRFKLEKEPDGSGVEATAASPRSGGSKGNWQPESERDPERAARILRQHSQSAAVAFAGLKQEQGQLPPDFGPDELKALIDWFDLDAEAAGRAAR